MGEVVLEAEDVKKVTSNNNRVASRPISGDISIELETPAGDKRRSAAADISQFRAETSPASYPTSISHTRSSSLLQESSNTKFSSVLQDSSKSASSHQGKRSQSRTSSRLDTSSDWIIIIKNLEILDPRTTLVKLRTLKTNANVNGNHVAKVLSLIHI